MSASTGRVLSSSLALARAHGDVLLHVRLGIGPLGRPLVARIAERIDFLAVQQITCFDDIAMWPEVPRTAYTRPESASTPMWAFIPNCHWLPFWLECISGSRALASFLVELGAAMSVASMTVPARSSRPLWPSRSLTVTRICSASSCFSSAWRNRRMVHSSGSRSSQPLSPANSRNSGTSCRAFSIAGSLRVNHCCMKWMRSKASTGKRGDGRAGLRTGRGLPAIRGPTTARRAPSRRGIRACGCTWWRRPGPDLLASCAYRRSTWLGCQPLSAWIYTDLP